MASLHDVLSDKPIEFWPYITEGFHSELVNGAKEIIVPNSRSGEFINYLLNSKWKGVIEEDLQGIAKKDDGTLLLSTFIPIEIFSKLIFEAGNPFNDISAELKDWKLKGCNEVTINFCEKDKELI